MLWARTGGGGHGSLLGEGWRVTWHQDCLSEKKLGHNRNDGAPRCLLVQVDACVLAGAPTGFTGLQVGGASHLAPVPWWYAGGVARARSTQTAGITGRTSCASHRRSCGAPAIMPTSTGIRQTQNTQPHTHTHSHTHIHTHTHTHTHSHTHTHTHIRTPSAPHTERRRATHIHTLAKITVMSRPPTRVRSRSAWASAASRRSRNSTNA